MSNRRKRKSQACPTCGAKPDLWINPLSGETSRVLPHDADCSAVAANPDAVHGWREVDGLYIEEAGPFGRLLEDGGPFSSPPAQGYAPQPRETDFPPLEKTTGDGQ